MKFLIKTVLIYFNVICFFHNFSVAQKIHKPTGFIYTGELFEDPDWGWSYKTSEEDRNQLSKAHNLIIEATKNIIAEPGDYSTSISDMSFAFDPQQQQTAKENGSKCVTCYYSHNPNNGEHFQYRYNISFDLVENSETNMKKYAIDDSISKLLISISESRKNSKSNIEEEEKLKNEVEKFQKEMENIDISTLDEKRLAEIEEKGKRFQKMNDNLYKNKNLSDDTLHAMNGFSYTLKSDLEITTNNPLLQAKKTLYLSLKNKKGYYFKELTIPGCDFACIYFDMYNKSENLQNSSNPVFIAYIGNIYINRTDFPKEWLKPFCVWVKYYGNIQQINEIYKKIDFAKLRQIAN